MQAVPMTEAVLIECPVGAVIYARDEHHGYFLLQLLQMEEHDFLLQQFLDQE